MYKLSDKIGQIAIGIFATILVYSFLTSILFGYSGAHWQDQISTNQRFFLNLISIVSSGIVVFLGFKYRYLISHRLINVLSQIKISIVFIVALLLRLFWVLWSGCIVSAKSELFTG
jgi:hypothetical protein